MDYSLPGSSDYGISQARITEWVAIPFSRDFPDAGIEPRAPALQADSLPSEPPQKPLQVVRKRVKADKSQTQCPFSFAAGVTS